MSQSGESEVEVVFGNGDIVNNVLCLSAAHSRTEDELFLAKYYGQINALCGTKLHSENLIVSSLCFTCNFYEYSWIC